MSIYTDQMWFDLKNKVKAELAFISSQDDETVVKKIVSVITKAFEDSVASKDQWDLDDINLFIKALWEHIDFPRLADIRTKITEAVIKKLEEILEKRTNSSS